MLCSSEHVKQLVAISRMVVVQVGVAAPAVKISAYVSRCCSKSILSPQVVYSASASVPKVETVKPANNKDDDIDIDAI